MTPDTPDIAASVGDAPTVGPDVIADTRAFAPAAPPGFVLEGELGRGGMGVVFQARQLGLNRPVALKMILGERIDQKHLIRFLAEAEAVASVKHPNVVEVYQFGENGGRPYLAMEFCGGGSLPTEKADPRRAAATLAAVADGVAAAHAAGIVHRDLKPGNVLLSGIDEAASTPGGSRSSPIPDTRHPIPVPKVSDFGLAKRAASSGELTKTNAVMGTPAYMSPEQAQGGTKFVGPPADVWSLGVMLYEQLCGERPFGGDDTWQVLAAVMNADVPPLRKALPGVPRDLELICLKCLEKNPADRYPTAKELADDLRRFLAGETVSVRPAGAVERGVKWAKRNKPLAAALAATALALVCGTAVSLWQADRARGQADRADQQAGVAADEAKRAEREAAAARTLAAAEAAAKRDAVQQGERTAAEKRRAEAELRRAEWLLYETEIFKAQRALADGRAGLADHHLNRARWDFRGVEHDLLSTARQRDDVVVRLFPGASLLALSADGRRAFVGGAKGNRVQVVDLTTGNVVNTAAGHAKFTTAIAPVAGGSQVASAGPDGVFVWDAVSGKEVARLRADGPAVNALVAWENFLAGGTDDGKLIVWEVPSAKPEGVAAAWKPVAEWDAGGPVRRLAYSSGLSSLTSAVDVQGKGQLRWWSRAKDNAGWVKKFEVDGFDASSVFLASSADGMVLGAAGRFWGSGLSDSSACALRFIEGGGKNLQLKMSQTGSHRGAAACCGVSPDGRFVLTGGGYTDKTVCLSEAATSKEIRRWEGTHAAAVRFTPDGEHAAYLTAAGELRVLRLRPSAPPDPPAGREVVSIDSTPDGRTVVTGHDGGVARVHDSSGRIVRTIRANDGFCTAAISPAGALVATGGKGDAVRVWNAADGTEVSAYRGHGEQTIGVAFLPNGRVISASSGGAVHVWDARTAAPVGKFASLSSATDFAVSPDGTRVAVVGSEVATKCAAVFELATGKPLAALNGHEPTGSDIYLTRVSAVAFSPDGAKIVTGGQDGTVRVWGSDGNAAAVFRGHQGSVVAVRFSADGSRVISGGYDGTVRVWGLEANSLLLELTPEPKGVYALHTAADASAVFAGGASGRLTRYDTSAARATDRLELENIRTVVRTPAIRDGLVTVRDANAKPLAAWSLASGRAADWVDPPDPAKEGPAAAGGRGVWANYVQPVYVHNGPVQVKADRHLADRLRDYWGAGANARLIPAAGP